MQVLIFDYDVYCYDISDRSKNKKNGDQHSDCNVGTFGDKVICKRQITIMRRGNIKGCCHKRPCRHEEHWGPLYSLAFYQLK